MFPEKFQPKNLIEKPTMLWTSIVRSINQGSNKWADKIFDEMAPIFLILLAASLDGYQIEFTARERVGFVYLGMTRGMPFSILSAIAGKTGGRHLTSQYAYKSPMNVTIDNVTIDEVVKQSAP